MAKSFESLVRRTTTKRTRQRAAARTRELLGELLIGEVRKLKGKTQQEVADSLGIKQPGLAKLEKQSDMQISTLRRIVKALGGELELFARFPKGKLRLGEYGKPGRAARQRRRMPTEVQLF
jgi:transcriptional regulator with XRE-family HTH domain